MFTQTNHQCFLWFVVSHIGSKVPPPPPPNETLCIAYMRDNKILFYVHEVVHIDSPARETHDVVNRHEQQNTGLHLSSEKSFLMVSNTLARNLWMESPFVIWRRGEEKRGEGGEGRGGEGREERRGEERRGEGRRGEERRGEERRGEERRGEERREERRGERGEERGEEGRRGEERGGRHHHTHRHSYGGVRGP